MRGAETNNQQLINNNKRRLPRWLQRGIPIALHTLQQIVAVVDLIRVPHLRQIALGIAQVELIVVQRVRDGLRRRRFQLWRIIPVVLPMQLAVQPAFFFRQHHAVFGIGHIVDLGDLHRLILVHVAVTHDGLAVRPLQDLPDFVLVVGRHVLADVLALHLQGPVGQLHDVEVAVLVGKRLERLEEVFLPVLGLQAHREAELHVADDAFWPADLAEGLPSDGLLGRDRDAVGGEAGVGLALHARFYGLRGPDGELPRSGFSLFLGLHRAGLGVLVQRGERRVDLLFWSVVVLGDGELTRESVWECFI